LKQKGDNHPIAALLLPGAIYLIAPRISRAAWMSAWRAPNYPHDLSFTRV